MQTPIIKIIAKEKDCDSFSFEKQLKEFRKEKIYCTLLSGKNNPGNKISNHILAKTPLFTIVDRYLYAKNKAIPLNLFNISELKFGNFPIHLKLIYQIITQAIYSAEQQRVEKNYHFKGGLLGQISYEYKSELEDDGLYQRTFSNSVDKINHQPWPMFHFTCFQDIQIYLLSQKKVLILQQVWINDSEILKSKKFFISYNQSQKKNYSLSRHLSNTVFKPSINPFINQSEIKKNKKWYIQNVQKIKEYIKRGDCYQVNISRPVTGIWRGSLLKKTIFAFKKNPTAFQGEYHFNSIYEGKTSSYSSTNFLSNSSISSLISTSPECLFRIDKIKDNKNHVHQIYSYPIKGTIATSKKKKKDKKNQEQLLNSCKDKAELAMITDLIRNDLHRIGHGIEVKVEKYPHLESYENIHHLMSIITGKFKNPRYKDNSLNTMDLSLLALKYLFPGGSITGTPKIKSANIIEQLEGEARWAYTGSLGYFSIGGTSQFNILIRSLMLTKGYYYYRVGGGITLLSDPKEEWKETLSKEKTLKKVFLSSFF